MPKPSLKRKPKARRGEIVLKPVRPNLGLEAEYKRRLEALIAEMQASTVYFIKAAYRANTPRIALAAQDGVAFDESPANLLQRTIKALAKRWLKKFDEASVKLGEWFAGAVNQRSQAQLKKILQEGGIALTDWKVTKAQQDVLDATVHTNVALIKSIPAQYFEQINGLVMRSVQTGRDLGTLTDELQQRYGVTRRRAALIAKTQNNMATASLNKVKQIDLGITEAIWMHSGGGHEPRPTHWKAGKERQRYNVAKGWYDPNPGIARFIQPGELINCRCVSRPVLPGL